MHDETERWITAVCEVPILVALELMRARFTDVQARPMTIKTHQVAASPEKTEYLVESGKTGARAAHRPPALRKA